MNINCNFTGAQRHRTTRWKHGTHSLCLFLFYCDSSFRRLEPSQFTGRHESLEDTLDLVLKRLVNYSISLIKSQPNQAVCDSNYSNASSCYLTLVYVIEIQYKLLAILDC